MDASELLEPFDRMLATIAMPAAVRAVEGGSDASAMWSELAQSGFLDALVPEEAGGAGLSLSAIAPLIEAIGAHALPLPAAETMVARALLAGTGLASPDGPIALATAGVPGQIVPCGLVAAHVLIDLGDRLVLAPIDALAVTPTGVHHALAVRIGWEGTPAGRDITRPRAGLRALAAVVRATLIAGTAHRLLELTTRHANERVQFGKPIGRQQALQQNLAVMAEDAVVARIAAQLGCAQGLDVSPAAAAVAKSTASSVAARLAGTAHAVHGAIGISEEFDLQLLTRRLHEWRLADGSEGYWNGVLGAARLADPAGSVDWIRAEVFA
ncbi:acyl-CoA dehydrogenase family protein [Novosphingobium sp. EMRT-2]|uniref:acyl-CoA dehydrogenase family protein n=1 Tax=Novosphingobium sp. EMRT-2 TaxID=2571749 RepID=UPI0010BDD631|nr:acyl-CoA dehydrogenase family protein [Novosphingobium sp. EMRT-2]QCI96094.1 acyl-CoA dehydrogenase [Novosphingobium sp. EMRT-2]